MLRKTLIAIALLATSAGVMAGHNDRVYGRVVSVEPHFVLSYGGGSHHDGFRVRYEFGGHHYWTHSQHHPGHYLWVSRPTAHPVYHYRHHDQSRHDDWRERWQDRRDAWRDRHSHYDRY